MRERSMHSLTWIFVLGVGVLAVLLVAAIWGGLIGVSRETAQVEVAAIGPAPATESSDGDGGRTSHADGNQSPQALLSSLSSPDPATRRRAAEQFGYLSDVSPEVVSALLWRQDDENQEVSAAILAALDRIQPSPDVAVRLRPGMDYAHEELVCTQAEYTAWFKVDCVPLDLAPGEELGGCWQLVAVPACYEKRVVHADPIRDYWLPVYKPPVEVPARQPDPPPPPPPADQPPAPPTAANSGEVWCEVSTSIGNEWRRHRDCEVPSPWDSR